MISLWRDHSLKNNIPDHAPFSIFCIEHTQKGIISYFKQKLYHIGHASVQLSHFLKLKRKELGMTQVQLADTAGVGLRFIRDIEQGKPSLRLDKVNTVLALFGSEMVPGSIEKNGDT